MRGAPAEVLHDDLVRLRLPSKGGGKGEMGERGGGREVKGRVLRAVRDNMLYMPVRVPGLRMHALTLPAPDTPETTMP